MRKNGKEVDAELGGFGEWRLGVQFLYNGELAYVRLTDKTERGIHGIHHNAAES